jgi:hypothetical protein
MEGMGMQKLVASSMVLLLCALGGYDAGLGEQIPAPQGELRIVDTREVFGFSVAQNVVEHLVEVDTEGTLVPRLATGWHWLDDRTPEVSLRQAYFLFRYHLIQLYAVNTAVEFEPHPSGLFSLAETSVTEQHWSVRKQKAGTQVC